mmetsp:Transcript_37675/g.90823  ORF Transcript_37675/g.90823 Transcript_37675/m.90823 type:complete len:172 (+) Transcript_37675:136-651(+)
MQDAGIMSHLRPIACLLAYHIVVIVAHGFIGGIISSGLTAANAFAWTPSSYSGAAKNRPWPIAVPTSRLPNNHPRRRNTHEMIVSTTRGRTYDVDHRYRRHHRPPPSSSRLSAHAAVAAAAASSVVEAAARAQEGVVLADYAPAAASLFNNMKLPSAVLMAGTLFGRIILL